MKFKRLENETEEQFLYRLGQHKEEIGTWEDITDIMNSEFNHDHGSSKYRKTFMTFKRMFESNESALLKDNTGESLSRLKEEIRSERIKLQTCNVERNRIDRQNARTSLWFEQVGNYVRVFEPPSIIETPQRKGNVKYVQTIADVHMGAKFVSSNNSYDFETVRERFGILLSETRKFIKEKRVGEMTVVGLGDTIHGILRYNDLRINSSTVVEATIQIANIISEYLNELSRYCRVYYYDVLYGNHSQQRYLGSKANAMMDEDLGYVIGHFIKTSLSKNDRVLVVLPKSDDMYLEITNIFDFKIVACHGHQFKNVLTAIRDLSQLKSKFYDYLIMGHYHNDRSMVVGENKEYDIEVLVAPSVCGSDNFSDSIFKGSQPASAIYGFDRKYGHVETYKIILR